MNFEKIFDKFLVKKIKNIEYHHVISSSFSIEVFKGEVSNYNCHSLDTSTISAIINNKLIVSNTENLSSKTVDSFIDDMIENANYLNKESGEIYAGHDKYKKFNFYNKDLKNINPQRKIDLVLEMERKLKAYDSRISDVEAAYSETEIIHQYQNSNNIKLKRKFNNYSFGLYGIIKDNDEIKTHYFIFEDKDLDKFNVDKLVKEVGDNLVKKLHPAKIESGKYNVVFSPEVTATLLEYYIAQLNAEKVLKGVSWFKDKLNTQVASKKVTVLETPLKRDARFRAFDAQGVPTSNRILIKQGQLLTYLHNLETARKMKVTPTGHAVLSGAKIDIKAHDALYLKPGRLTQDEIFMKTGNGIYITELEGLHAGMNPQSGDFSLKSEGFIIKNGKLDKAVDMITVNSNLFDIFNSIKQISQNIEYIHNGIFSPCIQVDNIAIAV